jgi:hypothetical protein
MSPLKRDAFYEVRPPVAFGAAQGTLVDDNQEIQMQHTEIIPSRWESIAAGVSILGAFIATVAVILYWMSQVGEWPRNFVSTGEPSGYAVHLFLPDAQTAGTGRLTVRRQGEEVLAEPLRITRTVSGLTYLDGGVSDARGKLYACGSIPKRWCLEWRASGSSVLPAITIMVDAD